MTPEHIRALVILYDHALTQAGVPKRRMDPGRSFGSLTRNEIFAHAHYLCDGAREYAGNPEQYGKANRHLTAIQMCLGFANCFTLEELMEHNRKLPRRGLIVNTKA